ncbi:MAG: hypothetical protein AAF960_03135 [Bacteroidota bacterium]
MVGTLNTLAIPSTLQDSLLARLDRLSPVKEIVQVGAVLGREFSLDLLQAVLPRKEAHLKLGLGQLVEAELLYPKEEGSQPFVYQFKHALIQDAAYDSLLKSRRLQLHHRVANVLSNEFKDIAQSQPELLAHHYTKASIFQQAIPLWLKAGQQASQQHANAEATSHLESGLALLPHLSDNNEKDNFELNFLLSLGGVRVVYYGYTHPIVGETLNEANKIAQRLSAATQQAFIIYNLMTHYMLSEKYQDLKELIKFMLEKGENEEKGYLFKLFSGHLDGVFKILSGEFSNANLMFDNLFAIYDASVNVPLELTPGGDVKNNIEAWLSLSLQVSGFMSQANEITARHLHSTKTVNDSRTLYHIYAWATWQKLEAKEWKEAEEITSTYLPIAKEFGDPFFIMIAETEYYLARAFQGYTSAFEIGIEYLKKGIEMGATTFYGYCELFLSCRSADEAFTFVEALIRKVEKSGTRMHIAELYRVKGLALQALGKSDQLVEESFQTALNWAKKQAAKTYELRAALALGELWQKQGKTKESYALVKEVYDWFPEELVAVDLEEARDFLNRY